ncbi:hypothetical protein BLAT2472_30149 [Burkholderia latens]
MREVRGVETARRNQHEAVPRAKNGAVRESRAAGTRDARRSGRHVRVTPKGLLRPVAQDACVGAPRAPRRLSIPETTCKWTTNHAAGSRTSKVPAGPMRAQPGIR